MGSIRDRLKHAWNVFRNEEDKYLRPEPYPTQGASFGYQTHRTRLGIGNEKSIVSAIYNRIAIDVAAVDIRHVRLDVEGRYEDTIDDGLNQCLTVEANIDQASRAFIQDVVMSMFDKGCIAMVPVETTLSPEDTGSFDIQSLRVGEIVAWHPRHVRINVYDDRPEFGGLRRDVTLPKSTVAIIENPLYSVMNEPNSTLQRLIRKLNLLDVVDEQSASGKLDLLIQLPYTIKSDARREQAQQRKIDIEAQLKDSQYGIAYLDATEKVTQLNRAAENNLMSRIEYLIEMLYGQLGITKEVMDGTADEKTMLNYYNRTIEPILAAITQGAKRSFLTKTARTQRQSIEYYRDPFRLMSAADVAEIADKFTRNEIATGNEIRGFIGLRPSKDPKANELRNSNIPQPLPQLEPNPPPTDTSGKEEPSK